MARHEKGDGASSSSSSHLGGGGGARSSEAVPAATGRSRSWKGRLRLPWKRRLSSSVALLETRRSSSKGRGSKQQQAGPDCGLDGLDEPRGPGSPAK